MVMMVWGSHRFANYLQQYVSEYNEIMHGS